MLAIGLSFTSCDNDEGDSLIDTGSTLTLPKTRVFILNEGIHKLNNAGMAFYAPNKDADFVADIFMKQNKKRLGDTGQDVILYKNYMYVSVFGSQVLLKLNSAGVEEKRVAFSKSDGAPRQLVADNGKIYVTLYSGKVAKIDATTLDIEGYVEVGKNPEGIAEDNDWIYAVNSGHGKDSTMTVIDKKAFAVSKTIIVAKNPQRVLESEGHDIDAQGQVGLVRHELAHPAGEVVDRVVGGVDDAVGHAPQAPQERAFMLDPVEDRAAALQRVGSAGGLEASDQHGVGGVQEDEPDVSAVAADLAQVVHEVGEELATAHVDHRGQTVHTGTDRRHHSGQGRQQLGR